MAKEKFSKKMNQLNEDNKSYAKGRMLLAIVIVIILGAIWAFTR